MRNGGRAPEPRPDVKGAFPRKTSLFVRENNLLMCVYDKRQEKIDRKIARGSQLYAAPPYIILHLLSRRGILERRRTPLCFTKFSAEKGAETEGGLPLNQLTVRHTL